MTHDLLTHLEAVGKNAVDLISKEELSDKLKNSVASGKPLTLKIGFDPTASDIHLGHTVLLRKLRTLQDLGHRVTLLIGDFTAKIGDPSGRSQLRPVLSYEQIAANASTYTEQAFKILDRSKTDIVRNSTWYKQMSLSEFLSLLSNYTVARVLERDDFTQRLKENKPLTLLEIMYPLIQGYDSVWLKADIEFGGTDQKFNLLVGRHLQQTLGQPPQVIVTMPILVGLDGKNKMSKSLGNYIGVTDAPSSMFGKIMSIDDETMWEYYRLLTDHDVAQVKKAHPKEAKLALAEELVAFYHSKEEAGSARAEFERVFSHGQLPDDIATHAVPSRDCSILDELCRVKAVPSKNEGRRLREQGALYRVDPQSLAQTVIAEDTVSIPPEGLIIKIGKKKFLKLVVEGQPDSGK